MNLSVSPEVCFSDDGDMQADTIYLYPKEEENNIAVGGKSIYSVKDINELCDLLFGAATIQGWRKESDWSAIKDFSADGLCFALAGTLKHYKSREVLAERIRYNGGMLADNFSAKTQYLINNDPTDSCPENQKAAELGIPIIPELLFMEVFDEDYFNEYLRQSGMDTVSVKDVAPITIEEFKDEVSDAEITLDNLETIKIRNSKSGWGESAIYIPSYNDRLASFREKYKRAAEDKKEIILKHLIAFIKSEPQLEVKDNECQLPERIRCVWGGSDEGLEILMQNYLTGKDNDGWNGTYSKEFTIDVSGKTVTSREVLYF